MPVPPRDDLDLQVRAVRVDEARALRDRVLRPGRAPGGSVYPGDDAPETGHYGAYAGILLVAVASICREAPRTDIGAEASSAWRLRGMATAEKWRGRGVGERLARVCIGHARERGARRIWCSAREQAAPFYARLGFRAVGEPYELRQYSDERYVEMHLVP